MKWNSLSWSRRRSIIGLILALPLAGLIAGIFACLPVPIGDPEKSKVDPKLLGGWIVMENEDSSSLYIVRKFDERTCLVQALEFEVLADKSIKARSQSTMKMWLTKIGENTFMCGEMIRPEETLGLEQGGPLYYVARLDIKGDQITVRPTNPDAEEFNGIKSTADAEAVLKAHGGEDKIYKESMVLKKVGKEQTDTMKAVLRAFTLSPAETGPK